MRNKNIFESVQFLNEEGGLGLAIAIAGTVAVVAIKLKDKIDQSSDRKKILNGLNTLADNGAKDIAERIKSVRSISRNKFYELIPNISDKDKYYLETNNIIIYGCIDTSDNLMAYIIYNIDTDNATYGLVDKKIKGDSLLYINGMLEYKTNYFGPNLKKIVESIKTNLNINKSDIQKRKADSLDKNQENKLYNDLKNFTKSFERFMKSKIPNGEFTININSSYSIHDKSSYYYADISIHDKNEPNYEDDEKAYDHYWRDGGCQRFSDSVSKAFKDFIKINKLADSVVDERKFDEGIIYGDKDNYPYIYIERFDNPDDNMTADFTIGSIFDRR